MVLITAELTIRRRVGFPLLPGEQCKCVLSIMFYSMKTGNVIIFRRLGSESGVQGPAGVGEA